MKRMIVAIAACVVVWIGVGELLGLAWNAVSLSLSDWAEYAFPTLSALPALAAVAVGTFIARGRFLVPALMLWVLGTAFALTVGFRIQIAALPMTSIDFLARNLPYIGSTLVASACGLALGRAVYALQLARRTPNNTSKPTPVRGAA